MPKFIVEKTSMGSCPTQDTVEASSMQEAVYYWMEHNLTLPHNIRLQPVNKEHYWPGSQEFVITVSPPVEDEEDHESA